MAKQVSGSSPRPTTSVGRGHADATVITTTNHACQTPTIKPTKAPTEHTRQCHSGCGTATVTGAAGCHTGRCCWLQQSPKQHMCWCRIVTTLEQRTATAQCRTAMVTHYMVVSDMPSWDSGLMLHRAFTEKMPDTVTADCHI
jgi:hypothetical protein